jgi:hypothetical protein
VARASCSMRSRRRPRPAAAVHHRDRAAARPARIPARRHRRPDRALDDIRQLAAAQRAAHYLPADSRLPIQPGPPGHGQPAKPPAARTQHRVVPAPPPRRPRHPAPRPYPARLDPRLVTGGGQHRRHRTYDRITPTAAPAYLPRGRGGWPSRLSRPGRPCRPCWLCLHRQRCRVGTPRAVSLAGQPASRSGPCSTGPTTASS